MANANSSKANKTPRTYGKPGDTVTGSKNGRAWIATVSNDPTKLVGKTYL